MATRRQLQALTRRDPIEQIIAQHDCYTSLRSTVDLSSPGVDLRPGQNPIRKMDQAGRVWLIVTTTSPSQRRRDRALAARSA